MSPIGFHEALDGELVLAFSAVDRVWFSSQLDGRSNGRESCRYFLYSDLSSAPETTFPDPVSVGQQDSVSFELGSSVEPWIDATDAGVVDPMSPVFCGFAGNRRSDAKSNCSPRRHDIIRDVQFFGRRHLVQDSGRGSGNVS